MEPEADITEIGSDKLGRLITGDVSRLIYHAITGGIDARFQIFDPEYRILWNNFNHQEMEEYGLGDWPGKVCHEYYFGLDEPCSPCPVQKVMALDRAAAVQKQVEMPDGSVEWIEVRGYPIRDNDGHVTCVMTIGYDITAQKRNSQQLKRRLEALETFIEELTQSKELLDRADVAKADRFDLTRRELEVLRLMAEGLTNNRIADFLEISPHTVKSHVIHIFNKLGVNDRTQAAVWAARLGLI